MRSSNLSEQSQCHWAFAAIVSYLNTLQRLNRWKEFQWKCKKSHRPMAIAAQVPPTVYRPVCDTAKVRSTLITQHSPQADEQPSA